MLPAKTSLSHSDTCSLLARASQLIRMVAASTFPCCHNVPYPLAQSSKSRLHECCSTTDKTWVLYQTNDMRTQPARRKQMKMKITIVLLEWRGKIVSNSMICDRLHVLETIADG